MSNWNYNGQPFTSKDIPTNAIGFVYVVTNKQTGIHYIGKKLFFSTITKPPLKGKTRKRKIIVESDWATYCGSSETVKAIVQEHGLNAFDRKIIHIAYTRTELSYLEMKEQIDNDVLLRPNEYYNAFIGGKINRSGLKRLIRT